MPVRLSSLDEAPLLSSAPPSFVYRSDKIVGLLTASSGRASRSHPARHAETRFPGLGAGQECWQSRWPDACPRREIPADWFGRFQRREACEEMSPVKYQLTSYQR